MTQFDDWYAAYQITQELEPFRWGKDRYDMTLDHCWELANSLCERLYPINQTKETT